MQASTRARNVGRRDPPSRLRPRGHARNAKAQTETRRSAQGWFRGRLDANGARARRSQGRTDARLLYRLANKLLDHRALWHGVRYATHRPQTGANPEKGNPLPTQPERRKG